MMLISMITKIENTKDSRWFHYMTSWNYMLAAFYFTYALIKHVLYKKKKGNVENSPPSNQNHHDRDAEMANRNDKNESDSHRNQSPLALHGSDSDNDTELETTTKSDKFLYFLFSISYTMCFMVIVIYWMVLFKPSEYPDKTSFKFFLAVDRHAIIFILLFIQYVPNKIPIRILHSVYVVILALLFFVHTYFYYLATDKLVYSIFDWANSPGKAIGFAFGLTLACFVLQFIIFLLDLLKHRIAGN